ncbi:hypothetical protein H9X86_07560 [Pseudoflavonifractor capillosus]|uniref:hypothetical protein n=1 Tax=Pseudoflavonifractor capillosus TaxID=106588 RepID=UPI00195E2476|nr:hypothetical protein [Pseudoflavonifractor capillosus]MBM6897226.1 hypothetical protein [Pseudoflavonifractor capillosus]
MRWRQNIWLSPAALVFGAWLSVSYIAPYGGAISLSSLVGQLSDGLPPEPYIGDLLFLTLRLLPFLLFEALAGTSFYRHYCTASVYIFSRMPNRLRWYAKECALLALETLLYQALVLAAAIGVSAVRWTVTDVAHGLPVLLCHLLIWSLWTFAFTLEVNLLAIFVGSSTAFAALAAVQMVCISALIVLNRLEDNPALAQLVKRVNPITCLILSWQTSRFTPLGGGGIYLEDSLALVLILAAGVAVLGGHLVERHDLLVSHSDGG